MEAFPPGPCVPCRNANRLSERKSGFVSSRDNDNAVRLKRRRRRRYFNLAGRRCGLHEREAQTVKGLTTGRFVILVAPWIPLVHANNSSVALNIELNVVVRFWHDASLCVMDLNSDVSNIAPVGCDLCTVRYKMDARWLLRCGGFNCAHDDSILGPHGTKRTRFIRHIPRKVQVRRGP